MLKSHEDAQGKAMLDYLEGIRTFEIVERDDGYMDVGDGPASYFLPYKEWNGNEKKAMRYVKGRILDIGCGAGKHSIYLQDKGFSVTGIDISPEAVKTARKRGLKDVICISIDEISSDMGEFDTVIMMGNNLGLLENFTKAKNILKKLHSLTSKNARIIGETRNPYDTKNPDHLEYHKRNRKKGRMPGQVRIRIIYRKLKTPWFDYLFMSKDELKDILKNTGWNLKKTLAGKEGIYIAILEKI